MVSLVSNGEQTFLDVNGDPLSGGRVYFYQPGTTTPSNTFTDSSGGVANANPVALNQAGRAVIWGTGRYRQVVQDQFGTTQWDLEADAGGGGGTIVGDQTIQGNATITNNLTVQGSTVLSSLQVNGPWGLNGSGNVSGDFGVNGTAGFQKDVTIDGILTVNNAIVSTNTVTAYANIVSLGNRVISQGGSSPSVTCYNTVDGEALAMWEASHLLQWGTATGSGVPLTSVMQMDSNGNLTTLGTVNGALMSEVLSDIGELKERMSAVLRNIDALTANVEALRAQVAALPAPAAS
jgi:hypothetical protein